MRWWKKRVYNLFIVAPLFVVGCASHSPDTLTRRILECDEILPQKEGKIVNSGEIALRFKENQLVKVTTFRQKPKKGYETLYIDKKGVAPQFKTSSQFYICGKAFFIFEIEDIRWACESQFTRHNVLGDLVFYALTYGIGVGTYYVEFSPKKFSEFVKKEHIVFNIPIFYKLPRGYTFDSVDPKALAQNDWGRNTLIFDQKSDLLFGYAFANELDLLSKLAQRAQELYLTYDEALYQYYLSKMPPFVEPPHIEPKKVVEKGEFETTSQFLQRVERIKEQEQKKIEHLQKEYIEKVKERNRRVKKLEKEMQHHREALKRCFEDFLTQLKDKAVVTSYIRHINSAFQPIHKRYDADKNRYYFAFETHNKKYLEGYILIDPKRAKELSMKKILLEPEVVVKGNTIEVTGYSINGYTFHLTQIPNLKLDRISLEMQTKIDRRKQVALQYQEPRPFGVHQNWIIKTLSSAKIDAPDWFTHPDGTLSGYGFGESYQKAFENAVRNLAIALYTRVESETNIVSTNEGEKYRSRSRLYTLQELRQKVQVIQQENRNGWWYIKVGLRKAP